MVSTANDCCHSHHLGGACGHSSVSDQRRLTIALAIIAGFTLVEVVGGMLSGSLALLADAGHMATDAIAIGLALVARHVASRPPSARFPFGQGRAQVLAAFVNGLALLVLIGFLLVESVTRIANPQSIDTGLMLAVAMVGLAANGAAFFVLHRNGPADVNMRGALLHVIGDILGSVAAIISAIVIGATGFLAIDPMVTLFVCALIGRSAIRLIRETGNVLLEAAPDGVDVESVRRRILEEAPAVTDVHAIKFWMLTPEDRQATMHVHVSSPDMTERTLRQIKDLLSRHYGVSNSTVQVETAPVAASKRVRDSQEAKVQSLRARFADHPLACPDVETAVQAEASFEEPDFVASGHAGSISSLN